MVVPIRNKLIPSIPSIYRIYLSIHRPTLLVPTTQVEILPYIVVSYYVCPVSIIPSSAGLAGRFISLPFPPLPSIPKFS